MAIKPMLFNTEMVRQIQAGVKTVTRRVVCSAQVDAVLHSPARIENSDIPDATFIQCLCTAPCETGDVLYVRETWCDPSGTGYPILYKADMPMHWDAEDTEVGIPVDLKAEDYTWRPSIHMPREAARIFLRVTGVRVEQLYDITGAKAKAEGFQSRDAFLRAFFSMYPSCTVKSWVWVIEFERCEKPEEDI